jgi:hypothetical protein
LSIIFPLSPYATACGLIKHREQLFNIALKQFFPFSEKNKSHSLLYAASSTLLSIAFFTESYPNNALTEFGSDCLAIIGLGFPIKCLMF